MTGSDNNRKKRPLSATTSTSGDVDGGGEEQLYLEEGLFAVRKPLGWTSQDVVGKLRFVLETDARERGAPDPRTKKRRPWMKVGHGGTLDPLATGVLVCGVGSGTRSLQKYLVGSKRYRAEVTLGYQTTTLDADPKGEVVEEKPYDHVVSLDEIDGVLQSKFTGNIQQIPPIFSALKRDGKKLYELGRKGKTAEDIKIEPRQVVVYDLKLVRPPRDGESERQGDDNTDGSNNNSSQQQQSRLPPPPIQKFQIDVECGGGTYIRSLVRDIGIELGTVATMTALERTKQGLFLPEHCVPYQLLGTDETEKDIQKDENGVVFIDKKQDCNWTVETITEAIRSCRNTVLASEDDGLKKEDRPTD
mmetsp:Transcript_22079/g.48027  ORF Transcript_22079/g.48027 Transcript_22079/m.48027 type:complete len:360 (+) Transcript_22079:718-1797(+)